MRILMVLICLATAGAAPALETARGLAASGAPRLALARVEQFQPREPGAPRWAEWEALRFALLVDLKRHDEALKRAAALPGNMPRAALRAVLLSAARAAVAAGQGGQARAYAARLLWQLDPTPDETRSTRLLVIESHVAERQAEAAFRAMLRHEQDYRPLDRNVAERFVEALLDLGLGKEALGWLASLEDTSAIKLRLQLRSGLIGADAAIARARAQIARPGNAGGASGYWLVLAEAATRQGNGALRVEVLERMLDHAGANDARRLRAPARELWQAYLLEAQATANRGQVLAGDDTAWADLAARRLGAHPHESRALFAWLSRKGKARGTRQGAQLQLAYSLYQVGLDHAALHLFGDDGLAAEAIDPRARYLLGGIAEKRNRPAAAVRFWQGLAAPADAAPGEWEIRLAAMQWRSGAADAAVGTVRVLAKSANPLPVQAVSRAVALAREVLAAGQPAVAEEMLAALLPAAGREHAREMLLALGDSAQSAAQFARAADYFLRAALADGSRATDALALRARLAAAVNLARAGYREDARAQFRWVIGNSKVAAQLELARRELSRL